MFNQYLILGILMNMLNMRTETYSQNIFDELLAYVKNFSVFCTKVVYVSFICI